MAEEEGLDFVAGEEDVVFVKIDVSWSTAEMQVPEESRRVGWTVMMSHPMSIGKGSLGWFPAIAL